jgi:hypothetical protein
MINNNNKTNNFNKEQRIFWLGRGGKCIHYIINWNAGLTAFGDKRTDLEEQK